MAKWYNKVDDSRMKQNVIAATFYEHYDEILNFYNNRASNAAAESFNAKIKLFRANLHGVVDKKFFLFRIAMLYGYPPLIFYCTSICDARCKYMRRRMEILAFFMARNFLKRQTPQKRRFYGV